jgi:iron(III) transport system permease protein
MATLTPAPPAPAGSTPPAAAATRIRPWMRPRVVVTAIAVIAITACILVPIGMGLYMAFRTVPIGEVGGAFTLDNLKRAAADPTAARLIGNTVLLTVCAAGLGTLLGITMAWIVTSVDVPMRKVLYALPLAPALIPGLMKDTAWINLYGPRSGLVNIELQRYAGFSGPIFNIYSMTGMILILMLSVAPISYLVMVPAFTATGRSLNEASQIVGASRLQTFFRVTLPAVRPAIISGVALSAILVAAAFETPILIGLPAGRLTYIAAIYRSLEGGILPDYNLAAAQALVYLVLTIGLLIWYLTATRKERRFALVMGRDYGLRRLKVGAWRWVLWAFVVGYFLVAFVQPLAGTVIVSFLPFYTATSGNPLQHWTLSNYTLIFHTSQVGAALRTSLLLSIVVAILATLVAVALAWVSLKTKLRGRRVFEFIGTLPVGVPPLVYATFLLMSVLFIPGVVHAYNSIYPLIVADVVVLLPFSIRIISGAVLQLHDDLIEAPRVLGSGIARSVRTIILPLLRVSLLSSAVLIFALSFRELGAVVFLTGPNTVLLPTLIFQQWETGQQLGPVAALNILSVVVSAGALLLGRLLLLRVGRRRRIPTPPAAVG